MVLAGILRIASGLGFVYASKEMIDLVVGATPREFIWYAMWMLFLTLGGIVLNALLGWISSLTEVTVENRLRHRLFEQLLQSQSWEMQQFHSGDLQSRLGMDIRNVSHFLSASLPLLIVNTIQLSASFLFLKSLDNRLAYIAVLSMIVFLLFGKLYAKRMRTLTHQVRSNESAIQSLTQESIQYRVVIKTLEQLAAVGARLLTLQSTLYSRVKGRARFSIYSKTLLSLGFASGYLLTFIWGAFQLQQGLITFGVMTAFLQLVGQLQRPIVELTRLISSFVTTLASIDRLIELELLEREDPAPSMVLDGCLGLRLSDVDFGYDDRLLLAKFSYNFTPGSTTAVLGQTGVGKTTLIRLLLALIKPLKGELTLYNSLQEIEISAHTRANFIYVPQGNTLFSGTIRDNLLLGNPDANEEQMNSALYSAAADFVHTLPQGLDTRCGEQGSGLSEGQAQRISIARSLLRPGSVLLLDEVSSALDLNTEQLLSKRLISQVKGKTIILITHREEITKGCDKLVLRAHNIV